MRLSGRSGMCDSSRYLGAVPGQLEPERRAAARAVVEADAALHELDQPLADREAEAGAALLPGRGRVGLAEAAEDAPAEVLRDAAAAVACGRRARCGRAGRRAPGSAPGSARRTPC